MAYKARKTSTKRPIPLSVWRKMSKTKQKAVKRALSTKKTRY